MSLRTQAAWFVRAFAALVVAAGSQAQAQVIIPSMSSSGVAGFHHVGETINAVATVSSTPSPSAGTVTFELLDASSALLSTPCLNVVLSLGPPSDSACAFSAPTTPGNYSLRMNYSGDGILVGPQTISEPFTVGLYATYITYTGIPNTFTPEKAGTVFNIVATVNSGGPLPTGSLQYDVWKNGTFLAPLCTVALDASAQGSCAYTTNAPGFYEIHISYGGDASNEPGGPVNPFVQVGHTVVSAADSGIGTLRAAIDAINLDCSFSTAVLFDIPGTGPHSINVASQLPPLLCNGASIDGTTQPGWSPNTSGFGGMNASLQIILAGGGCTSPSCPGLVLGGNSNSVRGLAIHSFQGRGIAVASANAWIAGNYIGTDPGGAAAFGNGTGIEVIGSADIGSSSPEDSNLIVNSATDGIHVTSSSNAFIENALVGGLTNGAPGNGNGTGIRFSGAGFGYVVGSAIRYNSGAGVVIETSSRAALGDNAVYDNGGPGIDLNDDGPSGNDEAGPPYDIDGGANGTQNYPVITSATTSDGLLTISGYLKTDVPNSYTNVYVELYSNVVPRPTATGGDNIIAAFPLSLDGSGFATFTQTIPGGYDNISATATVDSCSPPSLRDPALEPKSRRAAKAEVVSSGCPVTSEYSPTVAAVAAGPAITLDVATLSFVAPAGTSAAPQTVTLTNTGTDPVTFSLTPFTVPADFTLAHGCPAPPSTLAVGLSCQAVVTFLAPATQGTYSGVIKTNSDSIVPADIAVSGLSTPPPMLTLSPNKLTFGPQDVGTPSIKQTVTVANDSPAAIAIASVTATGDFAIQSGCPASLAPATSCTVDVKFLPSAVGSRTGALDVAASGGTQSVSLAGTGTLPAVSAPAAAVTPLSLTFANRTLFTTSPAQAVNVTNAGNAPLTINSVTLSGDYAFTSTCPASLAPGAGCAVNVTFTPLVTGTRTGSLLISTNAPGSPVVVALSGVGVDVPVGTLDISPSFLDFAAQPLNVTSDAQLVSVTNVGSATVFILDITLTGDFAFDDVAAPALSCGGPLAPAATCVLALTFRPTAAGDRTGTLRIASDGTNFSAEVGLAGFGVAVGPQRALGLPGALSFGAQPFGTRSAGQVVVLTNNSAQAVVVSHIDASGDFAVSESCTTIPARGTCSATVFFTPTARGTREGVLTVRIVSETLPYLATLSGEGTANPVPILSIAPSRIGFGNAFVGTISAPATVELSNIGEAPLLLDGLTAPGDFVTESHCGSVLAARARCTVDVRFFARMLGARSGLLEIRSNAGGSPHYVELSGTGCSIPNVGRNRIPQLLCGP